MTQVLYSDVVQDWSWMAQMGPDDRLDAGWVPVLERPPEALLADARIVGAMPDHLPMAPLPAAKKGEKCTIAWDSAKGVNSGKHLPTYYQQTGSCVGNGADKACLYTMAIEIHALKEREKFAQTFMPYVYGRSRSHAGMGGRQGEGSFGTAAGKAAKQDGVLLASTEGLPASQYQRGLTWGSRVEMEWSAGDRIAQKWLDEGRRHPVKEIVLVQDADEAREHLRSGRVFTIASSWGGQMRPRVHGSGDLACLLNTRVTRWMHQMMCSAWWWHPELGELFYIDNSWSEDVHGVDPAGGPPGGFWITKAEMQWILAQGDSVVYGGLVGWPDDSGYVDWSWMKDLGIRTAA